MIKLPTIGSIIAVSALFSISAPANADIWNWAMSLKNQDIEPFATYNVSTSGQDLRVYKWLDPITNEVCTAVAGSKSLDAKCIVVPEEIVKQIKSKR